MTERTRKCSGPQCTGTVHINKTRGALKLQGKKYSKYFCCQTCFNLYAGTYTTWVNLLLSEGMLKVLNP